MQKRYIMHFFTAPVIKYLGIFLCYLKPPQDIFSFMKLYLKRNHPSHATLVSFIDQIEK